MPRLAGDPLHVLLVEDDDNDIELIRQAMDRTEFRITLSIVKDGLECLEFLQGKEARAARRPDLILLDLNMPRVSGLELLQYLKADPTLKTIPIVVLTTSDNPEDIGRAYESMASCYVVKPLDFNDFQATIQALGTFWFRHVRYWTAR